jgi:hypothetical protein
MKTLTKFVLAFTLLVVSQNMSFAKSKHNKRSVKYSVEDVTSNPDFDCVEMFNGRVFSKPQMKNSASIKGVRDLLKKNFIEMNTGEIVYPEEIQYGIVSRKKMATKFSPREFSDVINAKPHESSPQESSPQESFGSTWSLPQE